MNELYPDEKELIKFICKIFDAKKLWIDGIEVNLPPKNS
jgi:hypothetical protein